MLLNQSVTDVFKKSEVGEWLFSDSVIFLTLSNPSKWELAKIQQLTRGQSPGIFGHFFAFVATSLRSQSPPPVDCMGDCAVALAQLEGRGWQSPVFMEEQWQVQDTPKHSLAKNRKRWTRTRRAGGDVDLWVRNTFTRGAPWMGKKSPLRTERAKVPLFWVHGSH